MPRLRSGRVVSASVGQGGPASLTAGREPGKELVLKQGHRLSRKRKAEQPLPCCPPPAAPSRASVGQFAPPVPVQKEQGGNSQKFPGKKVERVQRGSGARISKGVAPSVPETAECEGGQAAGAPAAAGGAETARTGHRQQLCCSGATLQNEFSVGIEREERSTEDLNLSVFHEGSRSSGKDGKYSCMEIKLKIPSSEEEIESAERHGISCLPKPEGLQPTEVTWSTEMKRTESVMMQNMQIPDLGDNLEAQEAMTESKPQEEADTVEKLNRCPVVGSRQLGTQEEERRCLNKKGGISLMKPKLYGHRKKGSSALLELHAQCPESRKGAVSMRKRGRSALVSQQVQALGGQEQPKTRGEIYRCRTKEKQQSSSPQKGAVSSGENAEEQLKAIEQDTGASQAVKKVETKQDRSEDSKEKESHYSESPVVAALGGTQSKSFVCRAVTKKSDVQYKKRKPGTGEVKHLQNFSVSVAEIVVKRSAKCNAEHCRSDLNHCSGLLCPTEKNPFVRLEDCSYINTFVNLSAGGTTSSYKLNGFVHIPHGTAEVRNTICSTGRMPNETSPVKHGLLSNKEKNENGEGCFSCSLSESSKCLRGNVGRKPRKKVKVTEKSAVQNTFRDMANEYSECKLQAEAAVAMTSSLAVSGPNHTLSASCDHALNLHTGKSTQEAKNVSTWGMKSSKLPAFENGFKKTSELCVIAKGENSSSVAHHSAGSGTLRVPAQVHDISDWHKGKMREKLNNVSKELQQITCQRTVPMTGKKVWPVQSSARTSGWVYKNHRSISEGKSLSKTASDKSSVKGVGDSALTGSLRQLDLHMPLAEIAKESTHKKNDTNTECETLLEKPESSSVDIYKTLRMSNENGESPVNTGRTAVTFNHEDVQEVKATLNFTTKQKDEEDGANRNLSVTVQKNTSTGNTTRTNFSSKVSVADQTFSDLKLIKALNPENLTKFKTPLFRNKPESRKLESGPSFERKTCSPVERHKSTRVSRRQKTGEQTVLGSSEQHPLPVMSDATSTVPIKKKEDEMDSKDFQHGGSENLSEMFVLPESSSAYPHPLLEEQPESSVPDFCSTECVLKPGFSDHSWNLVSHIAGLQINDDRKSKENLSQHESQNLPDIREAYEQDVLVIDVIQDDPDLFGTSNEEQQVLACCENSPVRVSSTNTCTKDTKEDIKPESPLTSEKGYSVENSSGCVQESGMSNDTENYCDLVLKAEHTVTHNSSRGNCPLGDVTEDLPKDGQPSKLDELLKSFDMNVKIKLADGVPDVKEEKKSEAEESDCKYKDHVSCELVSGLPLNEPEVNLFSEATVMKSWTNGYKPSGKSSSQPLKNCEDSEPQRMEKNAVASHSVQQILSALHLPRKYCRYYFATSRGCARTKCWFCHVPKQGDEKICMAILRTYINIKESGLLKRAVRIFVQYYREVTPGVDFASEVLNDLLNSLLKKCLLQEVFQILNVTVQIKTLPAVDVLLKVFEHVASLNLRDAVPTLIHTFCKLIDAGMFLELDHFDYIIKLLQQLQVSRWEISTVSNMKSRFKERHFEKNWLFDFNLAVDEIQHCEEKMDWAKLGALYLNARTGCECFADFQKLLLSIAEILSKDSETDRPGVPFCDFADAVMKNSQHNEADKLFIGRTGISVMYSYHKVLQWTKGRKVLDKLNELQIQFTVLKGLKGAESFASRCQIVNKAAEVFLHSGSLDGATRVLRESEWTTNAPLWPCDKTDILNRHNLLRALVHKYLSKSLYRQAFEVLQNFPGLQKHSDTVDVSQYSCLFNKLINASFENKNLGVSSSAVDFMLSKKIAIDFLLLRRLITALGTSSLWSKARTYYKSALSLGCYPQLQGNLHHKLLKIPSYLSEVEMLLAIEIFLVSNASDIQNPMSTSRTLQIVVKRCEDQTVQNNSSYQVAVERLIQAARLSDPKLFLKHMTMNANMEEVYSLELSFALKWLQENMKWAEKKLHVPNKRRLHCGMETSLKRWKNFPKNKVKYNRDNAVLQNQALERRQCKHWDELLPVLCQQQPRGRRREALEREGAAGVGKDCRHRKGPWTVKGLQASEGAVGWEGTAGVGKGRGRGRGRGLGRDCRRRKGRWAGKAPLAGASPARLRGAGRGGEGSQTGPARGNPRARPGAGHGCDRGDGAEPRRAPCGHAGKRGRAYVPAAPLREGGSGEEGIGERRATSLPSCSGGRSDGGRRTVRGRARAVAGVGGICFESGPGSLAPSRREERGPRAGASPCGALRVRGHGPGGGAASGTAGFSTARLGSSRHGWARHGSTGLGTARLGSAGLGTARLGSARHGWAQHGSAGLGSARLNSARPVLARPGSARARLCPARLRRVRLVSVHLCPARLGSESLAPYPVSCW
ncbi:protein TOPAZ1 [Pithys albifrons albifrons]|uniref:protein TOPAZ1 n=1 Tax=Pithys albifrons albifrons TaxID=3385563 RepID=UPI003A5CC2DE